MDGLVQNDADFEPAEEMVVGNLETLKAMADPLRVRLLEAFAQEPRTVKQVAADLKLPATKLYYHVNVLEEHGLLRVVGTRIVSGIIEKTYRTAAKFFHSDPRLFALAPAERGQTPEALLRLVLDTTRADLQRAIQAGGLDLVPDAPITRNAFMGRALRALPPDQAQAFARRLSQLLAEFDAGGTEASDDAQVYSLTLVLFPMVQPMPLEEDTHVERDDNPRGAAE